MYTFYRQKRRDGGVRTGVDLGDVSLLHRFEPPSGNADGDDPALDWYVDVRIAGTGLPEEPNAARAWLLDQAEAVREPLEEASRKLSNGVDLSPEPIRHEHTTQDGLHMAVVCSAAGRIPARQLGEILADTAQRWNELVRALEVLQEAQN
jgi:hypothetical protein